MYIQVYTYGMTTKVTKWGNSLALRIPQEIAEKYRLYNGARVVFTETQKGALITSVKETVAKRKLPTLKAALANFAPGMVEKVRWGNDVGKEIEN